MKVMTPTEPRIDHLTHQPPPVEWSSDHTARMVTQIAADVRKTARWVTFFGVCFIIWLALSGLGLLMMLAAVSEASS